MTLAKIDKFWLINHLRTHEKLLIINAILSKKHLTCLKPITSLTNFTLGTATTKTAGKIRKQR